MAAEISKPDFSYQWASGGAIVAPSNVKVQTGWTAEVPPFQWENYLQNRQDNAITHLFQKGISEWDAASNYYFTTSGVRSYVQGSDGVIYVAVQDSIGQNPTTDVSDTYWKVAFADNSTALTITSGDARYTQRANNLSDVSNTTTARTNLGVFTDTTRIDVASAATVSLTASAPATRNVRITGTTTITAFTLAVGQLYLVTFSGVLTLTNNANIVTNSGADITTAAGDTCWIRATAANVVEVLCYTRGAYNPWQSPSRALNTDYTNNTSRTVIAQVRINIAVGAVTDGLIAGTVQSTFGNNATGGVIVTHMLIIPPGATYRVNTGSLQSWRELVV